MELHVETIDNETEHITKDHVHRQVFEDFLDVSACFGILCAYAWGIHHGYWNFVTKKLTAVACAPEGTCESTCFG